MHGIDGRYATALYNAASKTKSLDAVETDLKRMQSVIEKDTKLRFFLETPVLSRDAKKTGVNSLLGKNKYSDVTVNFFNLLAENGRLDQTEKVIEAYQQLMTAHRGELSVNVTSAKELDAKTLNRLRDILSKSPLAGKAKSLVVNNEVNPTILGGLVIEVGDKTIDLSISSRITKLNRLLAEAI